jgi:O-methyltransferase
LAHASIGYRLGIASKSGNPRGARAPTAPRRDNFFIIEWFDWELPKASPRVQRINRILRKLGRWSTLQPPRGVNWMTNVEQRMNLYHLASQVLAYGVPGDLVELGCNQGQSSALIQKIIDHYDPSRRLHVYDSFEGLPAPGARDGATPFYRGQVRTTRQKLEENFQRYGLRAPEIHEGWFHDTLPTGLPDRISFAYLDGDFYESIKVSLEHVYPRLSPGAICLIDDYADPSIYPDAWNLLPGVKEACDEFFAGKPEKVSFIYSWDMSHGYFRKS